MVEGIRALRHKRQATFDFVLACHSGDHIEIASFCTFPSASHRISKFEIIWPSTVLRHHPQRHLRTDCPLAIALDCIYPHVQSRKCPTDNSALDRISQLLSHILCQSNLPTNGIRSEGCREIRHECSRKSVSVVGMGTNRELTP